MAKIEELSTKLDEINKKFTKNENIESENKVGKKDFGSGYFILNVDKKELYEFLKENMPAGYVHNTFEEFCRNLEVNHFEDDELNEVGLSYSRTENFVIEMVDDYIYIPSAKNFDYYENIQKEKEFLRKYEGFIASKFPQEYKRNLIKQIADRKRHYMAFYGEECRRAYKIYKDNMDALNKNYKEIFGEDCPVFSK